MICGKLSQSNNERVQKASSDVEEDGRLVGILHFLNTEDGTMHLIVDPRKVSYRRSLSNTTELVINGSVTKANPTLVCTQVRNRDATQVCANGGSADD